MNDLKAKVKKKKSNHKIKLGNKIDNRKYQIIKTVLQFATAIASIITVVIAIVSFWETHYEKTLQYNKVDGLKIERFVYDYESNTFLSNNQISAKSTFMYSLTSTENSNRYSQVKVTPILYVYLKNRENTVLDSQFIYLDKLYIDCVAQSTSSVIAFMDYPYSAATLDDFYRYYARYYNHTDNDVYVDADIIYRIDFKYLNNRNNYQDGKVFLSRDNDFVNLSAKKKLLIDMTLPELFQSALDENRVKTLDSFVEMNMRGFDESPNCFVDPYEEIINEINSECCKLIADFQDKHRIVEFYNKNSEDLS